MLTPTLTPTPRDGLEGVFPCGGSYLAANHVLVIHLDFNFFYRFQHDQDIILGA